MILGHTPCSRCGSREPNPGCHVCADDEAAQAEREAAEELKARMEADCADMWEEMKKDFHAD